MLKRRALRFSPPPGVADPFDFFGSASDVSKSDPTMLCLPTHHEATVDTGHSKSLATCVCGTPSAIRWMAPALTSTGKRTRPPLEAAATSAVKLLKLSTLLLEELRLRSVLLKALGLPLWMPH